jgi:maleylpyruvate isomerase
MINRDWLDEGTRLLLATVDRLADDEFDAPSALPDWTRRHVVAHVHYNAEALRRLVRWARTGEESRMYESPEHRAAEIEAGSRLPVGELRTMVHGSASALDHDLDALSEQDWRHEVMTAQGAVVPATEIPWMRTREVAVHAVDLAAGTDFGDLSDDLLRAVIDDVLTRRLSHGQGPDLARWLTGRTARAPELGRWL